MSMSYARASRLASICHKEFDFQFFVYQQETEYKSWLGASRVKNWLHDITENFKWNCFILLIALLAILFESLDMSVQWQNIAVEIRAIDITFNVAFFIDVVGSIYHEIWAKTRIQWCLAFAFVLDILSYAHYVVTFEVYERRQLIDMQTCSDIKIILYYLRLFRPLKYLWSLSKNSLKGSGSVLGTCLKYVYVICLMRVTLALVMKQMIQIEILYDANAKVAHFPMYINHIKQFEDQPFFWCMYLIDKMFVPIGPQVYPFNDFERVICIMIMITGTLTVTGVAIATMAIVLTVSLQHEESFRSRVRLITKGMIDTNVPKILRRKVETFYKMYWHKQHGVSGAVLLPTFPPTTCNLIYSEMYFEAQQKSLVLRDLSNQFLSELAHLMTTINYIPGDSIIKRKEPKAAIIYIAYGDVEMMSAEDDVTPMLRFCRGTVLNGAGGVPITACALSHVEIRAATFCTAHVLRFSDLWKTVAKFGRCNGQAFIVTSSFTDHFERVMRNYKKRTPPTQPMLKSSIISFKRNLIELKKARDANGKLLLARNDLFLEVAECYVMRNRADANLQDTESDRICLRSTFPCILQPTSSLLVTWNGLVALLTLSIAVTHPYYLVNGYPLTPERRFYDVVVSVIFILDIITHLSIGANIEEGVPITFRQTSTQQFNSVWLMLDLIAVLPIFEFIGDGSFVGLNKLLKLPKLFRSLKQMEDVAVNYSNSIRFVSYVLLLLLFSFLMACLQQGFMCFQYGYCEVTDLNQSPFWSLSKINQTLEYRRVMEGLYWAISLLAFTMHKTADWNTADTVNRIYVMALIEGCTILRIFLEAVYSATIMVSLTMRNEYETCIMDVKGFLIRNNVDPVLRHRFVSYLELCWHTDRAYSITHAKQSIIFDLPLHVSSELLAMERIKYMTELPFAKYIHEKQLLYISSCARLFYTSPNEILLNTGTVSTEMYIVKQGICEVVSPVTKKVIEIKGPKSHFGVLECFLRIPSFYTVRAVTHVQIFCIPMKHLSSVLTAPNIKNAIAKTKREPEYRTLSVCKASFLNYEYPQAIPNRSLFLLPRKHEHDTAFSYPFQRLGFLSLLRYVFPRWTLRPDGRYLQRYEFFRGICATMCAFVFPCYQYMSLQFPIIISIGTFLDYAAYFDIFQRMLVGYYDDKGILVYHPASTAAHYLKGAFMIDLLACLPMEILDMGRMRMYMKTDNWYRMVATAQYLMCNRLLQLYRIPSALSSLSAYIEREDILLIVKGMPLILGLLNVMTMVVLEESVSIYTDLQGKYWWVIPVDDTNSWIQTANEKFRFNVIESPFNLHLACYFWVVYETTTTGFNIFNPTNSSLLQVLFWGDLGAMMLTTYYSVNVISIRANVNQALATFQEHMRDIVTFMNVEKFPLEMRQEVRDYYSYSWDKMGGQDYRSMLKLCDQITLRTDAIMHIYGPTFSKCPVLVGCDLSLLRLMGRAVNSVYFLAETRLIERDDVIEDLYFVDYGTVEIKSPYDDYSPITKLPRGSMFGNCEDNATSRSMNTFETNNNVHLLKINTDIFYRIVDGFPETKHLLKKYLEKKHNYIIGGQRDPTRAMSIWKERSFSVAVMLATRKGAIKFFDVHNRCMQIFLIGVALFSVYLNAYNAAFQDNGVYLVAIMYILDVLFFIKIIINYLMSLFDFDKELKMKLLKQQKIYFTGVFKYDVLSCLPIELFCFLAANQWEVFAFLRLNRLFRCWTIDECFKRHMEKLNINLVISTLVSVAIWFTVFLHFMTCIWHYIGVYEEKIKPNSSWFNVSSDCPPCSIQYLCAFYFTLTTFTQDGVGDIMPKLHAEVIFTSILQVISTMLYMIYVGEFSNIITYKTFRFFDFYTKYVELMNYLKCSHVSVNLVEMMDRYALHLWRESRGNQIPYFVESAPQHLNTKIMSTAYMHHLLNHPAFSTCEPAFLRQLVRHLKLYSYLDGMYIVKENEITDSMYIIHTGTVSEVAEDVEEQTQLYHDGDNFGVAQGLNTNTPFTHSYKVLGKAQVLTLRLDDWLYLMEHFHASRLIIFKEKGDDIQREKEREKKRVLIKRLSMAKQKMQEELGDDVDADEPKLSASSSSEAEIESQGSITPPRLIFMADPVSKPEISEHSVAMLPKQPVPDKPISSSSESSSSESSSSESSSSESSSSESETESKESLTPPKAPLLAESVPKTEISKQSVEKLREKQVPEKPESSSSESSSTESSSSKSETKSEVLSSKSKSEDLSLSPPVGKTKTSLADESESEHSIEIKPKKPESEESIASKSETTKTQLKLESVSSMEITPQKLIPVEQTAGSKTESGTSVVTKVESVTSKEISPLDLVTESSIISVTSTHIPSTEITPVKLPLEAPTTEFKAESVISVKIPPSKVISAEKQETRETTSVHTLQLPSQTEGPAKIADMGTSFMLPSSAPTPEESKILQLPSEPISSTAKVLHPKTQHRPEDKKEIKPTSSDTGINVILGSRETVGTQISDTSLASVSSVSIREKSKIADIDKRIGSVVFIKTPQIPENEIPKHDSVVDIIKPYKLSLVSIESDDRLTLSPESEQKPEIKENIDVEMPYIRKSIAPVAESLHDMESQASMADEYEIQDVLARKSVNIDIERKDMKKKKTPVKKISTVPSIISLAKKEAPVTDVPPLWPMDSRRKSDTEHAWPVDSRKKSDDELPYDDDDDDEEMPVASTSQPDRRKSTVHGLPKSKDSEVEVGAKRKIRMLDEDTEPETSSAHREQYNKRKSVVQIRSQEDVRDIEDTLKLERKSTAERKASILKRPSESFFNAEPIVEEPRPPPSKAARKSIAVHLKGFAKQFLASRPSVAADQLMLQEEAEAVSELLNKPRSHSEVIFKRSQSVSDQPKPFQIPDFGPDPTPKKKPRKSMLAFKDKITTFEVSNEDLTSIPSQQRVVADRAAEEASMKAYADDIALKKTGSNTSF